MPESFLAAHRGVTIYDVDHAFTVVGGSLANEIASFRALLFDPVSSSHGSSRNGVPCFSRCGS